MNHRIGLLLYLLGVFLAVAGQLLLKTSANLSRKNLLAEYLNRYVLSGYALMLLSSLLTVLAYRTIALSAAPLFSASSYLFIGFFGILLFHEQLSLKKGIGYGLIVLGICLAAA